MQKLVGDFDILCEKTGKVLPLEIYHADTCLSDYWSGHHLPTVQIAARPMYLSELKRELMSALLQGDVDYGNWREELYHSDDFDNRYFAAVKSLTSNTIGKLFTDIDCCDNDCDEDYCDCETVWAFFVVGLRQTKWQN